MKDKIRFIIFIILVLVAFGCIGMMVWTGFSPPKVSQLNLSEISDGIYAYNETVVSSIPAQNYSMVTFCNESGNTIQIKGHVTIIYTDSKPYAVLEQYNYVNADRVTLYVPKGSVNYLGTVSVGRR